MPVTTIETVAVSFSPPESTAAYTKLVVCPATINTGFLYTNEPSVALMVTAPMEGLATSL